MDKLSRLEFLSKLKFSDEERDTFTQEFESILSFVDEIKDIEIEGEDDKDDAISLSMLREDEPEKSMPQEEVLLNAPKKKDGCYVTPLVVE